MASTAVLSPSTAPPTTMVAVKGDLDASTVDGHLEVVRSLLSAGHHLVLDLTPLDFLGTAGMRALIEVQREFRASRSPWALIASEPVRRLLGTIGEARTLPVVGSIAEALRLTQGPDAPTSVVLPVVEPHKMRC